MIGLRNTVFIQDNYDLASWAVLVALAFTGPNYKLSMIVDTLSEISFRFLCVGKLVKHMNMNYVIKIISVSNMLPWNNH
jgi:hypothetical protein